MGLVDARELLETCGWLSMTPPAFREAVLAHSHLRRFKAGETIYAEGDSSAGLWGLAEGTLGIESSGPNRSPSFAFLARKGFWAGAHSLVFGQGRQIGLVALRPCLMLHLPGSAFHAIARQNPDAWRCLAMLPLIQVSVSFGILDDLLKPDPKRRCAAILLRLAGLNGSSVQEEPDEIFVTQEQLAQMVNMSRTSLGDVLRDFERQGLVSRSYGRLVIERKLLASVAASEN